MNDREFEILSNYELMLERLYKQLPSKLTGKAYDIPSLDVEYIGEHTYIRNFAQVCERLRRDPRITMRYFLKELGKPGAVDDKNNLIIYGPIKSQTIRDLYNRFLETYVKCPTCGSYDTELHREGKVFYIRCLACGAISYVKPI
ncbi:MAG: translation initiation factor IF-2 subunit beta [Ignisphaera sp.]